MIIFVIHVVGLYLLFLAAALLTVLFFKLLTNRF